MDEHVMLVPNTMATPLAKTEKSKTSKLVTVALSLCVGGALFALGMVSSSAFHTADVAATTMSSIQSDVPEMNLESNQQTPPQGVDAIVAEGRPFRFRLAGRSNLCVHTNGAMVLLAPCNPRAGSQAFQYDKDTKSLRMAGSTACLGVDAKKNFKLESCSTSSATHNTWYDPTWRKFLVRMPTIGCLDNAAGETAGVPFSLKATMCDPSKRSQDFDILPAASMRPLPLETYPEMKGDFNIALIGSDTQCVSVSGAAISCRGDFESRRFTYDADKKQFLAGVMCVTAGEKETKPCAKDNANQVFTYDYAKAMFRGPTDNYNLCFPEAKRDGLTLLRWCDNNKKLY